MPQIVRGGRDCEGRNVCLRRLVHDVWRLLLYRTKLPHQQPSTRTAGPPMPKDTAGRRGSLLDDNRVFDSLINSKCLSQNKLEAETGISWEMEEYMSIAIQWHSGPVQPVALSVADLGGDLRVPWNPPFSPGYVQTL